MDIQTNSVRREGNQRLSHAFLEDFIPETTRGTTTGTGQRQISTKAYRDWKAKGSESPSASSNQSSFITRYLSVSTPSAVRPILLFDDGRGGQW